MALMYRAVLADSEHKDIEETAARIVSSQCADQSNNGRTANWQCDLQAIFDAVKHGNVNIPGLEHGVYYKADPKHIDYYVGPKVLLELCKRGACAEDCDSQTMFVAALAAAAGYSVGLREFKRDGATAYTHIYPVVKVPRDNPTEWVALDTTYEPSFVGWEPSGGVHRTLALEEDI